MWNTRREISYLQHNSPLLTRKADLCMNEKKTIDNPRKKIMKCVGAKVKDEEMR